MAVDRIPTTRPSRESLPRPPTRLHLRTAWAVCIAGGWFALWTVADLVWGWVVRGGLAAPAMFRWADLCGLAWAGVVAVAHLSVARRLANGHGEWVAPVLALVHFSLVAFVAWWIREMGSDYDALDWTVIGGGLGALLVAAALGVALLVRHLRAA